MLSLRSSVCPPPHSSLRFSLPPGGRWQSKTDGRSLRQYFLPPVNGYEAQATRALLHRKVRSITQPSPLGKVDCEARRMRLRCANNPSASLCSAPPFAQGRRKPHPPQAVLVATRSHSRENDTQSFSNALVPLRYPSQKGKVILGFASLPKGEC